MPAAATAGASSSTNGVPVATVASNPAPSTTTVAMTHPSSSDGVVTSARARPGERSSRPASRSIQPGWRHHTCAATPVHTRPRSTSAGAESQPGRSLIAVLPPRPGARLAPPATAAGPGARGS